MGSRSPSKASRLFRTEAEFVRLLQTKTPSRARGLKLGIGDDAAVVRPSPGHDLILKSDMSIEDVHFSLTLHPAASVGQRALARSLSDIAAMGGTPKYVLVSLALSTCTESSWIRGFYDGLSAMARRLGVTVVGGDTARNPGRVYIDVVAAGEVRRGRAIPRSGARPGDQIYVSGSLGASALGLHLLKSKLSVFAPHGRKKGTLALPTHRREPSSRSSAAARALQRHLYPEPRCALGRLLADHRLASAMIDISDGLSTDLDHLCTASGAGARIWATLIPREKAQTTSWDRPKQASRQAHQRSDKPEAFIAPEIIAPESSLELALHGGEDYELLFTVPKRKVSRLPRDFQGLRLHRIGEIVRSNDVRLVYRDGRELPLPPKGYDHFRSDKGLHR